MQKKRPVVSTTGHYLNPSILFSDKQIQQATHNDSIVSTTTN